ncbi:MAG: SH3 domain-containing protein [Thermomicrobiales bacterium]
MTDTGLSNRLRQHSRRSGIAVGLTMAVTIALCVLSSAYVFGRIEPYVAEVTGYDDTTPVPQLEVASNSDPGEETTDTEPSQQEADTSTVQSGASVGSQPTIATAGETGPEDEFVATHTSNPDFTINFRPGPSVSSGDPIGSLDPSTPLMFLDEDAIDEEGVVWLRFRTESGQEGWIREVDTQVVFQ